MLDCWLFWFLHAHEYEPAALWELLPQPAIRQATGTLVRIAEITEDKAMYDAREKAIRDRKWEINAAFRQGEREGKIAGKVEGKIEGKVEDKVEGKIEGEIEGEIKLIRTLQGILNVPLSAEPDLRGMTLQQLESLTSNLQEKLRNRPSS